MTIVGPLTIFILSILEMAHFSFAAFFSKLNGNDSFFTIAFINAYFFTVIVAFYLLFNKQKVLKVEVNEEDIKAAKRRVPIMFVSLAVLLTILLIIRGVEKGTITL